MPKKLTYAFIKKQFEKEGYKLLSGEYINNKQKLEYECPNRHKHSVRWNSWSASHHRCPYCAGQGKPTIEEIREAFRKEGYTLLTEEYVNNKKKLEYVCPKGHLHKISWKEWACMGNRCPYCSNKIKKTIEEVRLLFEHEGYTLLTVKYVNAFSYLKYICPFGHKHKIKWNNWYNGYRCPTCARLSSYGSGNPSWRGGISYEPYCPIWKDKGYKNLIKERDRYKCLNPSCKCEDSRLHIHHIDYNKKNCDIKNLITLCGACNASANRDRFWHTAWYRAIMYRRYGYVY